MAAVPLAPFAHVWVGGDIRGLAELAGTLYGYTPQVTSVAGALDSQVRLVVGAAGWTGKAASAFTAAWERDSKTAQAVGLAADQVAGIVGWLAVTLSQIEAGLEQAADDASAHGVPIGIDGAPPRVCDAGAGQTGAAQWLSEYQLFYAACMKAAQGARELAAGTLAATVRQILSHTKVAGEVVTAADLLADLLAEPSATLRDVAHAKARALAEIEEDLSKWRAGERSLGDLLKDLDDTASELNSIKTAESVAKAEETALTKMADYRVGDALDKMVKALRGGGAHVKGGEPDVGGDGEGGIVGDLRDIPGVDVLAATLGTLLGTYQDTHGSHPQSLGVALTEEGVSNFGGLEAAAVIAEVAGGPVGLVAGVLLPDSIDNTLHEPVAADIRQNGWVKGLVIAQGDIGKNNVEDLVDQVEQSCDLSEKLDTTVVDADIDEAKTAGKAVEQIWDFS